ncbi:uncharacterized protein LOC141627673 [Silene latifolia]|uniref:uncharacterized protein LOC141627673 n=1 Tax=Silene latifolia TaxID=37657 RepID=UPI003D76A979
MPETSNTIDVNDPHYVYLSDAPGGKLVATVFEDTGYGEWRRSMLIALSAKNKIGFIDGSIPKPSVNAATAKSWQRYAWDELQERFGQSNGAQLYGVQKQLNDFSQGNDDIGTYFTRLKSVWHEISSMGMNPRCTCTCNCGAQEKQLQFQEHQRVVQFLIGLNDSYTAIRGTILMQNPLPKMYVIYNNLLQEEKQGEIHNSTQFDQSGSSTMMARNMGKKRSSWNPNYKGYQGNKGMNSGNSRGNFSNGANNGFGGTGHYNNSQANKGNNAGFNGPNKFKGKNLDNGSGNAVEDKPPPPFCNYFKKYGHVIRNCYHLIDRNRRFAGNAFFNNSEDITFSGFGNGQSSGAAGTGMGSTPHSLHNNPYCSPVFNAWILDIGASDHFCSNKALFFYFHHLVKPYTVSLPNGDVVQIDTVGTVHIAPDFPLLNDSSRKPLVLGKNHNDFYLLHPEFHNASLIANKGDHVDDFTRCTWTHLLSSKSNAFGFIKSFIPMVQTQFDKKVKIIRSDKAFKLGTSDITAKFLVDNGILHQTSCFHTPQQNGVVERKHKHLLETARALKFQSNLPTKYLDDCVLTTTYIVNRMPSKVLQNLSPYQILFGKPLELSHMRAFGCLVYASTPKPGRDKFSPRATSCVFLRNPFGKKAYKL